MNEPTNVQTIMQGGKPAFVVIPYDDYLQWTSGKKKLTSRVAPKGDRIPHAVVKMTLGGQVTLARAWREWLNLTQEEVARRMGVTQPALAQIENAKRPRKATLEKLAHALKIDVLQLY